MAMGGFQPMAGQQPMGGMGGMNAMGGMQMNMMTHQPQQRLGGQNPFDAFNAPPQMMQQPQFAQPGAGQQQPPQQ